MKSVHVKFENNSCFIRLARPAKPTDEEFTAVTASGRFNVTGTTERMFYTTVRLREEAAQALLTELTRALDDLKRHREAYLMDSSVYAA
jgi:hypothetical protein